MNAWIAEDGDITNDLAEHIASVPESTSRGSLTRVLQLYRQLERLESVPSYAEAFRSHHQGWLAIRDDLRVFTAQSQAFFLLFDRLRLVEGAAGEDALKQAGDKYREICRKLYRQLTELLAQLLLMAEGSEFRIQTRLRSMGFRLAGRTCAPLPLGPFVFMGVMLILAILSVIAVVRPAQTGPMPLAITALLIGLTKTVGVLAAVLPKLRWAAFRPDSSGRLPYLGWLGWAGVAPLVALLLERLSFGILGHSTLATVDFQTYPLSPLAPTTFALSLAVAILCDIDVHLGAGWLRRISEGMLCGATMAISIFVCLKMLDIESATADQTSGWFPFVFSFSIGFTAGFFGPYLYRRAHMDGPTIDGDNVRTMEGGEITVENG